LIALAAAAPTVSQPRQVIVVEHRGMAEGVPENTLAAFRQSVDRRVGIIELDLRVTGDGHIVIHHDETLDRTTDCSGRLRDLALARLKSCDAGGGEAVPSLTEALDFIRDKPARLLLDIKPGTPLGRVMQEIREHRAEAKVIFGLRRARDIARVRRELPGATTLAFIPENRDAPAFADAGVHIIRLWSDWVEADSGLVGRTQATGPAVWIMAGRRLPTRERAWRALHARMIASGAQGLITDRPELISAP
jgi:glycerophosphoryl diester phosphodiesterase